MQLSDAFLLSLECNQAIPVRYIQLALNVQIPPGNYVRWYQFISEAKQALFDTSNHSAAGNLSSFENLNRLENLCKLASTDRAVSLSSFDTDPMLSFMSAMAEAQAVAMKEAQAAGIAHARDAAPMKYRGRKPSFTAEQLMEIRQLSQQVVGNNEIARQVGLSKFAVSRILRDIDAAYEKLARWEQP